MFSENLKEALRQEVVGQPFAINSAVRGVTRLLSGMTPYERSWCAYLFIGPSGTGRGHLVRTLARTLQGDESVLTLSCNPTRKTDPWQDFVQQLAPLVTKQELPPRPGPGAPRLILIQSLERAPNELYPMLARLLETGQFQLPDGRHGQLDNCLIFMTSGLCAHEILDTRIGFSSAGSLEDGEQMGAIVDVCRTEAETTFGTELLEQLDNLIVFSRLEEEHLSSVLERHFARMSRWLAQRGVQCTLQPAAKAFLLESGKHQSKLGAHEIILAHRREVEFPVADLLISSRLGAGSRVLVDRKPNEDHLHFTVQFQDQPTIDGVPTKGVREVPVTS